MYWDPFDKFVEETGAVNTLHVSGAFSSMKGFVIVVAFALEEDNLLGYILEIMEKDKTSRGKHLLLYNQ